MTKFVLHLCLLFLVFLSAFAPADNTKRLVVEGETVAGITIGMPLIQVSSVLKENFEIIPWGKYSYEYYYRQSGISLFVFQSDTAKKIFSISIDPKIWHGKTQAGLNVSSSLTVKDFMAIYGKPKWVCTEDTSELSAEYPDKGIYFEVQPISCFCKGETNKFDSVYHSGLVLRIVIGEIGTSY